VLHISWQNIYVRIGPVTEAVLSAIVFVSMIADGPMELAIIVSDPQQKDATRRDASLGQVPEHNHLSASAMIKL
jgi:hypothetical protein